MSSSSASPPPPSEPAAGPSWLPEGGARRPLRSHLLFAAIAFVYLAGFPYHPGLRSPNELCRLWQSRALVEQHKLAINGMLRRYGAVGDLSVKDGKYYPSKAPLLSFAAAPIYAGLQRWAAPSQRVPEVAQVFWSRLLLTVLPSLLMLVYLRRFLRTYVSTSTADVVVASYALGTLALHYAWMFVSHQITAVLVFGAFYALWRIQRGQWRPRGYLAAGAFAGAAVACEYTAALPLVALAVYALLGEWSRDRDVWARALALMRAAALGVVGAAPFIAGLLMYHQAAFGHPLQSGYKYLADEAYQGWHVGGFLGIRLPRWHDFTHSFGSPRRGLFTVSPWLLLALPGTWLLLRKAGSELRSFAWLHLMLIAGYCYFTASFAYESWGWAAGPRHMTPWFPFLCLPVALVLERLRNVRPTRAFWPGVAAALCALSILVAGSTALVDYVPDALSTALFGAVVPLLAAGYFPVTVPGMLGLGNPAGGLLVLGVIVAVALWVWMRLALVMRARPFRFWLGGLLTVSVYLGALRLAVRDDRRDHEALELLRSVWWGKSGQPQELWPARAAKR